MAAPDQARIARIEALAAFRAALIIYISRARQAVDAVGEETRRLRAWIEQEQPRLWQRTLKRGTQQLEQAEAEMFSARMSQFTVDKSSRQQAIRRAQATVREAEEKLVHLRQWLNRFDQITSPCLRQVDSFRGRLFQDLPKAVHALEKMQKALEAYAEVRPSSAPAPAPALADIPSINES
jgi:hypothetical protein